MTFEQILADLKQKKFKSVYFLHGKEAYFIDAITEIIETQVLSEGERSFNQTILYGKDTDHLTVVDSARRYPMMSSHQVVILKEAQEMRTLKNLQTYLENPMPTTVLVICHKHKKLNLNSGFGKALKANGVVFESKPLYDNQIGAWIKRYLQTKKLKIQANAAELIAEYLGTDLSKVVNELEKLAINLPAGTEVTDKHIEEHIGISKDYNVFELQKALAERNVVKANRIVNYFAANARKHPMPVLIGSLYTYFSKIYMLQFLRSASESEQLSALKLNSPFFLKEYRLALKNYNLHHTEHALGLLKEYDLKSKGVNYISTGKPEGELLKEMVWRILH